jgi:hypothetical protein
MKTIIESVTAKDWLNRMIEFDSNFFIDAQVSAKVVRIQHVADGPGVTLVDRETYELVEFSVSRVRLVTKDNGLIMPLEEPTKDAPIDSDGFIRWNKITALIEREILSNAKALPDFIWRPESWDDKG